MSVRAQVDTGAAADEQRRTELNDSAICRFACESQRLTRLLSSLMLERLDCVSTAQGAAMASLSESR